MHQYLFDSAHDAKNINQENLQTLTKHLSEMFVSTVSASGILNSVCNKYLQDKILFKRKYFFFFSMEESNKEVWFFIISFVQNSEQQYVAYAGSSRNFLSTK